MILQYFKGHAWWILQFTGCLAVYMALAYGKVKGLSWNSYLVYMFMAGSSASWMFLKSFELAPSFFQAWFLGTAALALFGFLGSVLYFKEAVTLTNYIGAIIALTGSILLIT